LDELLHANDSLRSNNNTFSIYATPNPDKSLFEQGSNDLFLNASIWGNNTQDARGDNLENALQNSGFFVLTMALQHTLIAHPTFETWCNIY